MAAQSKVLTTGDDRLVENVMIIRDNYDMLLVFSPKIVANQELHQVFSVIEQFSYSAEGDVLAGKVI